MAFVVHQRAVAGVGEVDAAVRMDRAVVGGVERLALPLVGEDGDGAGGFVADDAAIAVLERDLSAFVVERVAVGEAGGFAIDADVAVFFEPAELAVVGDIAPDEKFAGAAPGGTFGPE